MNVATRLCSGGKRVYILDFDLEAPGLDSFDITEVAGNRPGLVEYIKAFDETGQPSPIANFSIDVTPADSEGGLFILPAGRKDSAYQVTLSHLDWKYLDFLRLVLKEE